MVYPTRFIRGCNVKQQRRHGGRSVQLPDRVMNDQKATYYCSYLGHQNEVIFVGENSESHTKSGPFIFMRLFRIRGPISTWEGVRER